MLLINRERKREKNAEKRMKYTNPCTHITMMFDGDYDDKFMVHDMMNDAMMR
jgi:hypothetical protein